MDFWGTPDYAEYRTSSAEKLANKKKEIGTFSSGWRKERHGLGFLTCLVTQRVVSEQPSHEEPNVCSVHIVSIR